MKAWLALFGVGFPALVWLSLREPIWSAAIAAYFYFAIPQLEFNAPNAPYQAAFWALAVATSFRYGGVFLRDARAQIDRSALDAVKRALDAVRDELKAGLISAAQSGGLAKDIRLRALPPVEEKASREVEVHAPKKVVSAVRRVVTSALRAAAEAGEEECVRLLAQGKGMTAGALRSTLEVRVPPVVDAALDRDLEALTRREVDRAIAEAEKARRAEPVGTGPLGIPLPRGPLIGLLTNGGVWVHVAFTILTYVSAQRAQFDVLHAMTRFDQCVLLFIPVVAIAVAVRNDRHVRIFVGAWLLGTLHLCMNAITWWLSNGGRADTPGGQGNESNFLGAVIVTIAPIAFGLIVNSETWIRRGFWSGIAGIFALGVLATGSRAALVAFVACSGYWFFHTNRKGFALGGVMIAVACFLGVAPDDFWERMGTIFATKDRNPWVLHEVEPSKHERQVLWALAIDIFKENPWMGIGPRQYPYVSAERTDFVDAYQGSRGLQTHNVWLQLAAEYGLFGILIWAGGFFFSTFCYRLARWRLLKKSGQEDFAAICLGLEAGSIGSAIACVFNSFQWYDYHYWHFVFGPLLFQVARETMERKAWLEGGLVEVARPPPRYGPPAVEGLKLPTV